MAKSKAEKIADIELQMTQLENQRKKLLQQQKEQERTERKKRLCKRMGLFEQSCKYPIKDNASKSAGSDGRRRGL